jgi:hypothetical protein
LEGNLIFYLITVFVYWVICRGGEKNPGDHQGKFPGLIPVKRKKIQVITGKVYWVIEKTQKKKLLVKLKLLG